MKTLAAAILFFLLFFVAIHFDDTAECRIKEIENSIPAEVNCPKEFK